MQIILNRTIQRTTKVKTGIPDSLISREETINHQILELENRLALSVPNISGTSSENDIIEKIARLYDERELLKTYSENHYPDYYKYKYDPKLTSIIEVQQMLDPDEVILEYQLLQTELITFVISKDKYNILVTPLKNKLTNAIDTLRNVITTNPLEDTSKKGFSDFIHYSSALYSILIEPVKKYIHGKQIIIIPHNELTLIPFEVLISEKPDTSGKADYRSLHYLIKDFTLSYAFSANLMMDNGINTNHGSGTAIFLPDYSNNKLEKYGFTELTGADIEASNVEKVTRGKLFDKLKATEQNFKKKAARYKILHIASHTQLNEIRPDLSSFVMSASSDTTEDDYLCAYELMQLNLSAGLVVLSGCNTGFGVLQGNEGLISIARSFLYTGVRTIAFTLWQVADEAGAALTIGFYKHIRKGEPLNKALRNAKLEFLSAADPVKAHPFYWAGYIVVGKNDSISLHRNLTWLYIAVIMMMLTGAAWAIKKRKSKV